MSENERSEIRYMSDRIIDLLQKSSAGSNDMGSRYSRLLQLLWGRPPKKTQPRDKVHPQSIDNLLIPVNNQPNMVSNNQVYEPMSYNGLNMPGSGEINAPNTGTAFSWLDLGAAWSFATQNTSHSQSSGEMGDMMGEVGSSGFSPYDVNVNLLTDYRLLNDDSTSLIF
jgi:hypothetical protein